jgi:hypothetical protein
MCARFLHGVYNGDRCLVKCLAKLDLLLPFYISQNLMCTTKKKKTHLLLVYILTVIFNATKSKEEYMVYLNLRAHK